MTHVESEIEKKVSKIVAETENKISEINNRMNLAEKEANHKIASIENEIVIIRESAYAKSRLCTHKSITDRQNKLIELNKVKLIPQKEIENYLSNLKNSQKTVYYQSIEQYLKTKDELLKAAAKAVSR